MVTVSSLGFIHPTFFLSVRWINHKHVEPFQAQCRSETSKARRNCDDALLRGISTQWLVLTSYVFLKRKIPISTDTGSGSASFFLFFSFSSSFQKLEDTQNPQGRHQQQHSRVPESYRFNSTSIDAPGHKPTFGDFEEKQHQSSA